MYLLISAKRIKRKIKKLIKLVTLGEWVGVERWRRGCYFFKNIFLYTFELWNYVNVITDKEGQEKYLGQTSQATKPKYNGAAFLQEIRKKNVKKGLEHIIVLHTLKKKKGQ